MCNAIQEKVGILAHSVRLWLWLIGEKRNLRSIEITDVPRREEVMSSPSDALTAVVVSERWIVWMRKLDNRIRPWNVSRSEISWMPLLREIFVTPLSMIVRPRLVRWFLEYTLPKLYIKQQYCVSCAVHGRIVRARKAEDRRIREFVRPQFKGVKLGEMYDA